MTNGSLMKVENIAECSHWSILQYFWPALSDNRSENLIFGLKTGFTVHDDSIFIMKLHNLDDLFDQGLFVHILLFPIYVIWFWQSKN